MMKLLLCAFALIVHQTFSQIIKLECRQSAASNPLTCSNPQTCDDMECSAQNKLCCGVSTPGECGFSCQVGEYIGCYESQWWCYGSTVNQANILSKRYQGSAIYIDNQDGVLDVGTAAQIEYIATRVGQPIKFMLLASIDNSEHSFRRTSYEITHTPQTIGKQVVQLHGWDIKQTELRFAYEFSAGGEFPIPYENNKAGSSEKYHSFLNPTSDGQVLNVVESQRIPGGINIRFQARICLNSQGEKVDDSICNYVEPTSSTLPPSTSSTTSATTSATTEEGPDPICEARVGCVGQATPQYAGTETQSASGGSYSYIDMYGELRQGTITMIEYQVTRLAPFLFQVWEETDSGRYTLRHQMLINPVAPDELIALHLAIDKQIEVTEKWRYGFTYISQNGNNEVPIQYKVTNVRDENNVDTGLPYKTTECATDGCGASVSLGQEVSMLSRSNLVQKQFNIRPCMEYLVCNK